MTPRTPRSAPLSVLYVGMAVSAMGDDMAAVAYGLTAVQEQSSVMLSAVLLAQSMPALLLGLVGGALVDRFFRGWWWPVSLGLQAGVFAVMAVAPEPVVIVTGVACASGVSALTGPVAQKIIAARSVDRSRAGGHLATVNGLAQAVGAALGGIGYGLGGIGALLCANAVTFAVLGAVSVMAVRGVRIERDSGPVGFRDVTSGFTRLVSVGVLGRAGVLVLVTTVFATSLEAVTGVFVLRDHAGWSSPQVGLAWACWGVGVVLGSQLAGRSRIRPGFLLSCGSAAMGAVLLTVALVLPTPLPGWCLFLVGGAGNGAFNTGVSGAILSGAPTSRQGRLWAAYRWLVTMCFVSGYLAGGAFGAAHAVLAQSLCGVMCLGAASAHAVRRHRH